MKRVITIFSTFVVFVFSILIYRAWAQSTATTIGANITTTGNLTVDTNTLFVEATTNRVGIRTLTPDHTLTIGGGGAARIPGGVFMNNFASINMKNVAGTDSYGQIFIDDAAGAFAGQDGMAFYLNGASRMAIASSGNVGIGTTTPAQKLDVVGQVKLSGAFGGTDTGGLTYTANTGYINIGSDNGSSTGGAFINLNGATNSTSVPMGGARIGVTGNSSALFIVSPSGNVGISTASPVSKLQINNTDDTNVEPLRILNDNGNLAFAFDLNATGQGLIGVYSDGTQTHQFYSGGDSYINIGNFGIGTTAPSAKFQVTGGDAAIATQGNGVILKATDGASCYRVTVNNAGTLSTASVTCP